MYILHLEDVAGVAYILAKYQQLQGHKSIVLTYSDSDKYGINAFYRQNALKVNAKDFEKTYLKKAETADIVHIHSSHPAVLLRLRKKFGRSKKIVIHYHGTDIRGIRKRKGNSSQSPKAISVSEFILDPKRIASKAADFALSRKPMHALAQKWADAVLVSTPDLLQLLPKANYLPNPVDIDHFRQLSIPDDRKEAFTMDTEVTDMQSALEYCKENNISLDIEVYDRTKNPVMYADMPTLMKKYKVYVDIRYVDQRILENLSKTALESLACGLLVLDYRLKYHQDLPSEHDPMHVVSHLSTIYSK